MLHDHINTQQQQIKKRKNVERNSEKDRKKKRVCNSNKFDRSKSPNTTEIDPVKTFFFFLYWNKTKKNIFKKIYKI